MSLAERVQDNKRPDAKAAAEVQETNTIQRREIPPEQLIEIKNKAIRDLATGLTKQLGLGRDVKTALSPLSDMDIDNALYAANSSFDDIPRRDLARLRKEIRDDIYGYGPIQDLIEDPTVSEIMVNSPCQVYAERGGRLELTQAHFDDDLHVRRIIEKIVSPLGRRIDDSSPMVDARLPDGSRVNAVIPPVTLRGCSLTIRKFASEPLKIDDLIRMKSLSGKMAEFLCAAVEGRMNILISGGTGSGKTTLLNVLSSFIPETERIITIEDAAELQLRQNHVVPMEARPAGIDGTGQISIRDMVRNALRMRPDRIIVGEVRSAETLDMLQAMNTGHDGSLTTAHANSPRDAMSRIETMALMGDMNLPASAIRQQAASAFNLIVQQARFRDGSRRVTSITEVTGMMGDTVTLQEIYKYVPPRSSDAEGRFAVCGIKPECCGKMEMNGASVDNSWFVS